MKAASQKVSHKAAKSTIDHNVEASILLVAALATLGACAPLAEVRKLIPRWVHHVARCPNFTRLSRRSLLPRISTSSPKRAVAFYLAPLNQPQANCAGTQKIAWLCVITTSDCRECFP